MGAGIIGLTLADELVRRYPDSKIAIMEKETSLGMHASGRNSGVLHSGIYYKPGSLKAKVCSRGAARMRAFAEEHHIPCRKSGKIIIATCEGDLPGIGMLLENAKQNDIRAELLNEEEIKKIEPYANPYREGIYCPDTAVIDSLAVVQKLGQLLAGRGVTIVMDQEVREIDPNARCIDTRYSRYPYGFMFNCAGANADIIAKKMGLAGEYTLLPFKGIYYRVRADKNYLVRSNIYPVPDLSLPFLGVHLTRVISGDVYVGPTAIPAFGRQNYGILTGIKFSEAYEIGRQIVGMYLQNHQNFRQLLHTELKKYYKPNFLTAARRLVPQLSSNDLALSHKVGIRPQLVNIKSKRLEMDYIIEQTTTSLHVLNAISPAFTASFAFAEMLADRFEGRVKETGISV